MFGWTLWTWWTLWTQWTKPPDAVVRVRRGCGVHCVHKVHRVHKVHPSHALPTDRPSSSSVSYAPIQVLRSCAVLLVPAHDQGKPDTFLFA